MRNPYAERWVGTLRRECLDRILIVNRRHLERVLPRLHRPFTTGTGHTARSPDRLPAMLGSRAHDVHIHKREVIGGLINEPYLKRVT